MISWQLERVDVERVRQIIDRAVALLPQLDREEVSMSVVACHLNGCPLRLEALAAASDFDLVHDVTGIHGHVDRKTGRLNGVFKPRFAVANAKARP